MSAPYPVLCSETDRNTSTTQNQHMSPLLCLPPEIRTLNVTLYHVKGKLDFSIYETPDPNKNVGTLLSQKSSNSELTVFSNTCRQIRHEARLFPYYLNAFRGLNFGLTIILGDIGYEKLNRIQCIHVDVSASDTLEKGFRYLAFTT